MYCKPCVTQLNEKPTEASTYSETGRRKFANISVSQAKAESAKQTMVLEGIKKTGTI